MSDLARLPRVTRTFDASTVLDRQLDLGRADKVALISGDTEITYGQMHERVCRVGRALLNTGLKPGDRVLVVLDDKPDFCAVFYGAMRAALIPIPVNPRYGSEDHRHFLEDSGARAVVVGNEQVATVLAGLGTSHGSPRLIVSGAAVPDRALSLEGLYQTASPDLPAATVTSDGMAFWLYSSGSTGRPKAVVHRHGDLEATYEAFGQQILGIGADDITYSSSKMFHAYGLGNSLTFPLSAGATSVVTPGRVTPATILETVARRRPTLFFSVPTLYNAILNHDGSASCDLSSIRLCVSAAEPLPAVVQERWRSRFGLSILNAIGSTEMTQSYCSNSPGAVRPGSSGRPVPGYELEVRGDDGIRLEPGASGVLWVKGPSMFAGYWGQPEKTAAAIRDGWFCTGDRSRVDTDGFYWYEGRADDMVKVGGLWVSPLDIENALLGHPAVLECATVSWRVDGLTKVKAYVVLRPDRTVTDGLVSELQEWCKSRLHRYQYPHLVEFVGDLPRTVTGKIQRFRLRQPPA